MIFVYDTENYAFLLSCVKEESGKEKKLIEGKKDARPGTVAQCFLAKFCP